MTTPRKMLRAAALAAASLVAAACGGSSGAPSSASLEVACSGANCGAVSASQYAGSGIGIWQYRNTTGAPADVEFSIGGVVPGQQPVVLFTNGGVSTTTLPLAPDFPAPAPVASGALRAAAFPDEVELQQEARRSAGWEMAERNRQWGLARPSRLLAAGTATPPVQPTPPPRDPAVDGTVTHDWDDTASDAVAMHTTIALAKCDLADGRKAIFWFDKEVWTGTPDDVARLLTLRAVFCGSVSARGGYAKVTELRGVPWGTAVDGEPLYIHDAPSAPLSLHVVFLDLKGRVGGYFHGANAEDVSPGNLRSNRALAFFMDAETKTNVASTMLHELTHLVNYYQRTIIKNSGYDTWLEEMSAMMTEDIVPETVTSPPEYAVVNAFIVPYLENGGGTSLINWGYLDPKSYAVGGTFGAFLNRRYGLAVYQGMVDCPSSGASTYHACLDAIIRGRGGVGLDDEFTRMGTTVFGRLDGTGSPQGFGFPASSAGPYSLRRIDLSTLVYKASTGMTLQENGFQGTSHARRMDEVLPGARAYSRTGAQRLTVPAGTSVTVVVR